MRIFFFVWLKIEIEADFRFCRRFHCLARCLRIKWCVCSNWMNSAFCVNVKNCLLSPDPILIFKWFVYTGLVRILYTNLDCYFLCSLFVVWSIAFIVRPSFLDRFLCIFRFFDDYLLFVRCLSGHTTQANVFFNIFLGFGHRTASKASKYWWMLCFCFLFSSIVTFYLFDIFVRMSKKQVFCFFLALRLMHFFVDSFIVLGAVRCCAMLIIVAFILFFWIV